MSLIRFLFMYAALIWFPISSSLIQKLQTVQNSDLHIATGCVRMTPIDHLHEETKMLPVQDHLYPINSQYLARTLQPYNPSHSVVTSLSGIINMNQTFNPSLYIVLLRIYRTIFYPPMIMGPPSSHFILKLLPIPNLFYLTTVFFRLLPNK